MVRKADVTGKTARSNRAALTMPWTKSKTSPVSQSGARRIGRQILRWFGYLTAIFIFFSSVQVVTLRFIDPPFSAFMLQTWIKTNFASQIWIDWQDRDRVSPNLARAVLASEDQRFYDHQGFDWIEVRKAMRDHTVKGKSLRGASTITMQVARNMFLWPRSTWLRKFFEAYYTVLLEFFVPKNRILEVYLNVAQFGPSVYGVQAAARKFYGGDAAHLTADQAARLVVLLPAPSERAPFAFNRTMVKKKLWVLHQMSYIRLQDWP